MKIPFAILGAVMVLAGLINLTVYLRYPKAERDDRMHRNKWLAPKTKTAWPQIVILLGFGVALLIGAAGVIA